MTTIISIRQSKAFPGILLMCMLLLMCLYVVQINLMVSAAYRISGYEKEFQALSQETKDLQVEHAGSLSFKSIEDIASSLQFEKATNVKYLQAGGAVVARGPGR